MPARLKPISVLLIGPSPSEMGGMASVVDQMLGLDWDGQCRIELLPVTISSSDAEPWHSRLARHVVQVRRLSMLLRTGGVDILHIHTCSGVSFLRSAIDMSIARQAGCKVVLHIHGASFDAFYDRIGVIGKRLVSKALTTADAVIALSDTWKGKLSAMSPEADIMVIENAVHAPDPEPGVPDRAAPPPKAASEQSRCRFLLLARMDDWKGIDDLLDASAVVHQARHPFEVTLAGPPGSAGDAHGLMNKIADRSLTGVVRYVGPVTGKAKERLLRDTGIYIQPSHHEGMPISLLEALSFGLPVVATRVGAVPEVITDEREGYLVSSRRPDMLADAMIRMILDERARRAMSVAARRLAAERFSLERFADDLLALYNRLGRRPATPDGIRTALLPTTMPAEPANRGWTLLHSPDGPDDDRRTRSADRRSTSV